VLVCLVLLLWGNMFIMAGYAAGPEGQLFKIGVLGIASHLAGAILQPIGVPPLLGMLVMGIVLRNTRSVELVGPYEILAADVRYTTLLPAFIPSSLTPMPSSKFLLLIILALITYLTHSIQFPLSLYFIDLSSPLSFCRN
jgi:hypothetical protein